MNNNPTTTLHENTPLLSRMPRSLPQAYLGVSSSSSPSTSSARSSDSFELCDGVRCTCQDGHHWTPRSFTPDLVTPSDTASTGYSMHRVWRVVSYGSEYATSTVMRSRLERTRSVESSEDDVGCWWLCWPRRWAAVLSGSTTTA